MYDVERKAFENGSHNGLLLLFVITELTLIGRTYIQLVMIAFYSGIGGIDISVNQILDFYGFQFYLHILLLSFFRRFLCVLLLGQ